MHERKHIIRLKNAGKNYTHLFFSSLCMMFLPLVIVCALCLCVYYDSVQNKIENIQQKKLDSGVERLAWQLEDIQKLSQLMAEDKLISGLHKSGRAPTLAEREDLLKTISLYCGTNDLIDDIYLYYPGDRWVYGRAGTTLFQFFKREESEPDTPYLYITLDGMRFSDVVMDESNRGRFLLVQKQSLSGGDETVALFPAPVYKHDAQVQLLSIAQIKASKIAESLQAALFVDGHGEVALFDDAGKLVYRSSALLHTQADYLTAARGTCQIGEVKYVVQRRAVPVAGWEALLLTDVRQYPSAFDGRMILLLIVFAAVLLLSVALMTVFMNRNYAPLHDIYQIAQNYYASLSDQTKAADQGVQGRGTDEFQVIRGAIDELYNRVLRFSAHEKNYASMLQKEFWFDVLNQKMASGEEFARRARESGVDPAARGWCVMLTEYAASPDSSFNLFNDIYERLNGGVELYVLHSAPVNQHICIVVFPRGGAAAPRDLERACQVVMTENEVPFLLGVGRLVDDYAQIARSCFEAYTAIDYCHLTGKKAALFEDIDQSFISLQKPIQEITGQFQQALLQENALDMDDSLNRLKRLMLQYDWPLHNIRRTCFDLYNIAVETLQQKGAETRPLKNSNLLSDVMNIHFQDDAIDFIDVMQDLAVQCACPKPRHSMDDVLDGIRRGRQFANPDFSFSQVAQEAGMTNSSFTRAFQKHTGKLPTEYLVELRIQYAKELLAQTDQSVLEIAEAVGYYSASSFSKRFKSYADMTPKEYRQRCAGADGAR